MVSQDKVGTVPVELYQKSLSVKTLVEKREQPITRKSLGMLDLVLTLSPLFMLDLTIIN